MQAVAEFGELYAPKQWKASMEGTASFKPHFGPSKLFGFREITDEARRKGSGLIQFWSKERHAPRLPPHEAMFELAKIRRGSWHLFRLGGHPFVFRITSDETLEVYDVVEASD